MKILVTGSKGFVGKNLCTSLYNIKNGKDKTRDLIVDEIFEYDRNNTIDELKKYCAECDFVVNLAGVNRPEKTNEFYDGNSSFVDQLCSFLETKNNKCPILISSSIQVEKDNDYGKSKKAGEDYLRLFSEKNGNKIYIYRFPNLFGKWCRPNYNSVVATWCYNIAHGIDIIVNDPSVVLPLCYIDDVVDEIIRCMEGKVEMTGEYIPVEPVYTISLKDLSEKIYSFKESRSNLNVPDQNDALTKKLYATYLSYLPENEFSYPLKMNVDERGSFSEFIKTKEHGQVSINITKPGVTKGQHWHHTKNEKFLVVSGEGLIRFRKIGDDNIIEYRVSGNKMEVVDIPTGYTHSIENVGTTDLVTVMWANEIFDPERPDTYYEVV